jgi:hypothetical protein
MTTPTGTTIATKATTRRRTTLETRSRRRSSKRSCPKRVLPLASSSEEDENVKCNKGNFTDLCLMGKFSRNISNLDSDVSGDLSLEGLSLRVVELENALCNQDKLICNVFCENKKLNLELENSFAEIASLRSVHDDMSAKPCENCKMIMMITCGWCTLELQVNLTVPN